MCNVPGREEAKEGKREGEKVPGTTCTKFWEAWSKIGFIKLWFRDLFSEKIFNLSIQN